MRIAVIGSGIAGLSSSWLLSREHDVTLYEANDYLGGHTHTHDIQIGGRSLAVDSGFIVFNPPHYPLLQKMFDEIGIESQPTSMSFAVSNERSGLEYNATNLDGLFCQRRNLVSPRFLRMVSEIVRFYRDSPRLLDESGQGPTLGDYLGANRYSDAFRDDHLVPMASALWSSPNSEIMKFPAKYLVQFMANHQMLQTSQRPQWRVVKSGSQRYVRALRQRWRVRERVQARVRNVARDGDGVKVTTDIDSDRFDHAVLACHADQALAMIDNPNATERDVLGAIKFQENETVLHTDERLLPRRRKAWAAWNVLIPKTPNEECTVSYCMNILQSLDSPDPLVVSLNCTDRIAPEKILRRMRYHHPLYTVSSVAAQTRKQEIQGVDRLWFAGAYWGWGFHEDGIRSGVEVANRLGIRWP